MSDYKAFPYFITSNYKIRWYHYPLCLMFGKVHQKHLDSPAVWYELWGKVYVFKHINKEQP